VSALRVSIVQHDLAWEDAAANRAAFEAAMLPLAGQTDLVVLPEMFTTGFSMVPGRLGEPADGPSVAWMSAMAARLDAAVTGSLITQEGGRHFNRLWFATPDGARRHYDKRHLFRMGAEHRNYGAGDSLLVVEFRGWRIAPLVCYDLRFPVWSRRRTDYDYDLLLYVANWPVARAFAWSQLLVARAIENQAYVGGVNRVGTDGFGNLHEGASVVHDYLGATLADLGNAPGVATVALDDAKLANFRRKFPVHLDADPFALTGAARPLD
jgi:predicted amidohydrolase